jgi:MFS family permease
MSSTQKHTQSLAYLTWGVATFFYFYQYIVRIIPGIVGEDLKTDLLLNAQQFGLVGSLYVYAYALVQIPLGLILDKFGIKKVILVSIAICITGCFMMYAASSVNMLYLARFVIGMGSGCAFLVSIKVVTDFLPEGQRGLLIGATLTMGTMSAIFFSKPVAVVSQFFGWADTCFYIGMSGFVVLASAILIIPNLDNPHAVSVSLDNGRSYRLISHLKGTLTNKYVLLYAIMSIGAYTPTTVLSDLWGPSFLKIKFHLDSAQAASVNSTLFVGLALGCLFIPWFFERIKKIDIGIAICSVVIFFGYIVIIYLDFSSILFLVLCLFIIGFSCGSEMLCFTGVARYIKPENSGLAIGVVNTVNMLGGGLVQQLVGVIMDKTWDTGLDAYGLRLYSVENYSKSLSVVFCVIVTTFILAIFLRDRKY